MALSKLSVAGTFDLSGFIKDEATAASLRRKWGFGGLPALSCSLTFGTGSGQANWLYMATRTLAATTFDLLDLSGSLVDGIGHTIMATKLKFGAIGVVSPDGTKKVRIGPQNQSNVFQGPWGGTGATVYREVTHWDLFANEPVAGFTVTNSSADILPVYNPTGSSLDYFIMLAGV